MEENEIWLPIKEFEHAYEISNYGRVRSLSRIVNGSHKLPHQRHERLLQNSKGSSGYLIVTLCKNGSRKSASAHALVAAAFIANTDNKPQINHKNGIKTDNRSSNLEWVTASENGLHAIAIGLKKKGIPPLNRGIDCWQSILTEDQVRQIRKLKSEKHYSDGRLAIIYHCSKSTIDWVIKRKSWAHVL